jgi:hypothetical protein
MPLLISVNSVFMRFTPAANFQDREGTEITVLCKFTETNATYQTTGTLLQVRLPIRITGAWWMHNHVCTHRSTRARHLSGMRTWPWYDIFHGHKPIGGAWQGFTQASPGPSPSIAALLIMIACFQTRIIYRGTITYRLIHEIYQPISAHKSGLPSKLPRLLHKHTLTCVHIQGTLRACLGN